MDIAASLSPSRPCCSSMPQRHPTASRVTRRFKQRTSFLRSIGSNILRRLRHSSFFKFKEVVHNLLSTCSIRYSFSGCPDCCWAQLKVSYKELHKMSSILCISHLTPTLIIFNVQYTHQYYLYVINNLELAYTVRWKVDCCASSSNSGPANMSTHWPSFLPADVFRSKLVRGASNQTLHSLAKTFSVCNNGNLSMRIISQARTLKLSEVDYDVELTPYNRALQDAGQWSRQ